MTEVMNSVRFYEDFKRTARHAKKRIYLQSMLFESGKVLDELEPILIDKAKAGVDVRVTIDWVSKKYYRDENNMLPPLSTRKLKDINRVHADTQALIERWQAAGIKFIYTNKPHFISRIFSIQNRNHIKMYIIDDNTAWLGGVNLLDDSRVFIDIMVKYNNPILVKALLTQYALVNKNRPKNNYSVEIDDENALLIDAGIRGKSIIYDTAVEMIRQSSGSIYFASQFVPDGKLLDEILLAADQGVLVTIATNKRNHKHFTRFPYNIPYKRFLKKTKNKNQIKTIYQPEKVHAKLLIIDGERALFGSHNLVEIGVKLKTEEIAMYTSNKALIADIEEFKDTYFKNE